MGKLKKAEHIDILEENLKEENGEYEDELLRVVESEFNISARAIDGIAHSELYKRMVKAMEHKLNMSVRHNVPAEVVSTMREAIEDLRSNVYGLLSLLYFGSEFIVPKLYSKLLEGLSSSMDLSNDEKAFLILHTGVDEGKNSWLSYHLFDFFVSGKLK